MKKILFLLFAASSSVLFAQHSFNSYLKESTTSREHPLDITKMKVEVLFEAEKGLVKGKVTHTFTTLQQKVDSVFFDAPAIVIKSAVCNGQAAKFKTDKAGVWLFPAKTLQWDETGTIVFEYEATPRRGIYFIGWNETEPTEPNPFAIRKQIWTQGQGIDNRHWIPMYDDMNDKFITETVITFDKNYSVLSNGKLLSKKENSNGTTTWNYTMTKPHAGYLLMLAIGKYAVKTEKSAGGVTLNHWYYPEFADRMEHTYRYTPQMMDFLERETGIKYPWADCPYSQVMVQDFIYGAMENTTATIFGDFFNVDARGFLDRNYVGVNCHEMTHQWFGDFITARDGRDTWLQESYATYFPKQFSKQNDGLDEWSWQRRAHQNAAIEAGKKDNFPVRHTQGGSPRVYPKGAAVISMLEYVLGEDQWKRALNHYLKNHAYANVETNDLQQAIKDKLGLNLDWFFDEWIHRGGEPMYKVSYQSVTSEEGKNVTEITVEQTHKTDETVRWFKMPIWFEVHYADGTSDKVQKMIEAQTEMLKILNPGKKKIAFVLFDVNSNIIKQVTFKKSFNELQAQIEKAPNMLDRYDAVVAMKEVDLEQKRAVLLGALNKEKHHGIINEIVSQLINDAHPMSVDAMQKLISYNQKANTRESVLKSLNKMDAGWKEIYLSSLTDSSYDVVKTCMEKLQQQFSDKETLKIIVERTKNVLGMNNAIAIKREEITALSGSTEGANIITKFASPQYEFRTRINAFGSLKTLNHCDETVVKNLFQAICSPNSRLAGPAGELANHFALQFDKKQLMKNVFAKPDYTSAQRDILAKQLSWLN